MAAAAPSAAAAAASSPATASPAAKAESREEMLSRHRKETAELRDKEASLKKAAAKGSKAEQKAKKKQVEDEISLLSSQLQVKQSEELALLGYDKTDGKEKGGLDNLVMAIAGVSVNTHGDPAKLSKGARRRGKRAQQEAEREQRIVEEQSDVVSDRDLENEELEKKLQPLGLTVEEIKPDGHCLYRAVEHQLSLQHASGASPFGYSELRKMAADYMREHATEFLPFLAEAKAGTAAEPCNIEMFESFCNEVELTAAWGGQLELGALMHCLKKHVVIYSGFFPDVEMGKEYKPESGGGHSNQSIMLSYHVHAYVLGEHYNSVVPMKNSSD